MNDTPNKLRVEASQMGSLCVQIAVIDTLAMTLGEVLISMREARTAINQTDMGELTTDHVVILHEQLKEQVLEMKAAVRKRWPKMHLTGLQIGDQICEGLFTLVTTRKGAEILDMLAAKKRSPN